jgi:hypothetical protein
MLAGCGGGDNLCSATKDTAAELGATDAGHLTTKSGAEVCAYGNQDSDRILVVGVYDKKSEAPDFDSDNSEEHPQLDWVNKFVDVGTPESYSSSSTVNTGGDKPVAIVLMSPTSGERIDESLDPLIDDLHDYVKD